MRLASLLFATACVAALAPRSAAAENGPERGFRFERKIVVGGAGPSRLSVDASLLAGAAPGGKLRDLRLYDQAGREVPYLLVPPVDRAPSWESGSILPTARTKAESGFEVDLGKVVSVDRLRIAGIPAPFMKRARLEGSGDRTHYAMLVEDATIFDLPDEHLTKLELSFGRGDFRYLRLTWDDRTSQSVPLPKQSGARLVLPASPPSEIRTPLDFTARVSEPGFSRFRIRLPAEQLPLSGLEVESGAGHLFRPARVLEPRLQNDQVVPVVVGSATLRRVQHGDVTADDLRIPLTPPEKGELDLVVENANNPPLALTRLWGIFAPQPWIYFEAPDTVPLTARYGHSKLAAPHYDLEAVRDALETRRMQSARWEEPTAANGTAAHPEGPEQAPDGAVVVGAPLDTGGFAYARHVPPAPPGLFAVTLDAAVLAHSGELADLRIVDREQRQIPYLLEKRDEPLALRLKADLDEARSAGGSHHSVYKIALPYATLPPARLVLATGVRVFSRRVTAFVERPDPRGQHAPRRETVIERTWSHADADAPAPALTLHLPALASSEVYLDVDEGDNARLALAGVTLELPAFRARCFRQADSDLTVLYGRSDMTAPRYDLTLLAPRLLGAPASELALEPEQTRSAPPTATNRQTKVFWGILVAVVVVLLGLIASLLKRAERPA
jgi:hypothetical protein